MHGKSGITLMLHVGVPPKPVASSQSNPSPGPGNDTLGVRAKSNSIEDKVRAAIERIDDGCGSEVDFLLLRKVKEALLKKNKANPRVKNLLEMIEPTIRKFGYYF